MDLDALTDDIKRWGQELGFQQLGICEADVSDQSTRVRDWLAQGFAGSMGYLSRNLEARLDPAVLLPDTIRVISARMDYLAPDTQPLEVLKDSSRAYLSRYALGRDYHKVLRRRLAKLASRITETAGANCRAFTDSAPVLEKALGQKAGLGWMGKHTLLLTREAGSWFFLGEIYTNLPLPVDVAETSDHCGRCVACIKVCPTQAIIGPRQLDAIPPLCTRFSSLPPRTIQDGVHPLGTPAQPTMARPPWAWARASLGIWQGRPAVVSHRDLPA
jgi:epoxyqueuosine reductase